MNWNVLKKYCTKQHFTARYSDELMWSTDRTEADVFADVDVMIKSNDENIYQVDLLVDVTAIATASLRSIYNISIIYTTLVYVDVDGDDEVSNEKTLMVEVPNYSFGFVSQMLNRISEEAGYRPLNISFDFEERYNNIYRI